MKAEIKIPRGWRLVATRGLIKRGDMELDRVDMMWVSADEFVGWMIGAMCIVIRRVRGKKR
jgi:hypothetical protein